MRSKTVSLLAGKGSGVAMHLCLMNSAPTWAGGERMFLELALGFRQAGHAVSVVCRPGSELAARLPADIERCPLRCGGYLDVITLAALSRLFRRRHFDAVFCNLGRDCFLAGLAALPVKVPVVRVRQFERTQRTLHRLFIHRVLLSAVVSVSRATQDGLAGLHIPPERLFVIHNGIDLSQSAIDRAAARRRFGVGDGDFVVAYTGRLAREKGADLLPGIAARLLAAAVPLRLLVAGDGPLHDPLQRECVARQLGAHVSLLGFLHQPEHLLAAADAAVMPSRMEAFPVAALETLAAGTPLVACQAGGLLEILTHEDSGLLVPADDTEALADALLRLYQQPALAARLRERGRIRVRDFSRAHMIAQYEQLVRELARSRP